MTVSTAKEEPKPYSNPYIVGVLLGVVLFTAFFLTGSGLGASGPLNRFLAFVEDAIVPEHINQIPYLISMAGGDKNPLDDYWVLLSLGVVVGGFAEITPEGISVLAERALSKGDLTQSVLDGWVARKLGVAGPLGLQLDSLADAVTFGAAPSLALFFLLQEREPGSAWFLSLAVAAPLKRSRR